jgi:hypothetical protein
LSSWNRAGIFDEKSLRIAIFESIWIPKENGCAGDFGNFGTLSSKPVREISSRHPYFPSKSIKNIDWNLWNL